MMPDDTSINKLDSQTVKQANVSTASNLALKIVIGVVTGVITLSALVWFSFPIPEMLEERARINYTPTPLPPTPTQIPTRTPTITATPTVPPTITPTLLAPSAYRVSDITQIDPPLLEGSAVNVIILNDDKNVTVEPAFTNPQWEPSSKIAEQIGREIQEPFYATLGPGSVVWKMDVPLDAGLYELFVLDTLYSSGGFLNFTVKLGENDLTPVFGRPRVEFRSSQAVPQQRADVWQSIGIYDISSDGLVSISTKWEMRNVQTIVAVDRVMLVRLPVSVRTLTDQLPKDRQKYLVDDLFAEYDTDQYWELKNFPISWNDQFHFMENPPIENKITWKLPYIVPVSDYDVWVWIPRIKGTFEVTYQVLASDNTGIANPLQNEKGETALKLMQGDKLDGRWLSLGKWKVPVIYGEYVYLSVQMDIKNGEIGEVAADAAVFIKSP